MKTEKKIFNSASIIAGALLTTSMITSPVSGMDILAYNDLGSGAQVRSHLIDLNSNQANSSETVAFKLGELTCGDDAKKAEGEKTEAKTADAKTAEAKTTDAKTAEAKTTDAKTETKTEATEEKSTEAKCGEGKCGEGKCGA